MSRVENVSIVGDTLYFDIVHEDWGESDPPTFRRIVVAQVVQNEMIRHPAAARRNADPAGV